MEKIIYPSNLGTLIGVNKFRSRKSLVLKMLNIKTKKVNDYSLSSCKTIGIKNEPRIIARVEDELKVKVYNLDKTSIELYEWILRGKADGITSKGSLVEVKCRMNQIQEEISENDYAQIQAYMFMYGIENCIYVQCLYNEDTLHIKHISKNVNYWENNVLPQLKETLDSIEIIRNRIISLE